MFPFKLALCFWLVVSTIYMYIIQVFMSKQCFLLIAVETDPNAFSNWIVEVSDVWSQIFSVRDTCQPTETVKDTKLMRDQSTVSVLI